MELHEEKRDKADIARKLEKAEDLILKKDIISEVLADGVTPVIAAR